MRQDRRASTRASALIFVILGLAVMMVLGLSFLNRSSIFVQLSGIRLDQITAENAMDAGLQVALQNLDTAVLNIRLDSKLPLHPDSNISEENIDEVWDRYGTSPSAAIDFLKHSIDVQAYDADGNIISGHIFANGFDAVFSSEYFDPNPSDDIYTQIRYEFTAKDPIRKTSALMDEIFFEYSYTVFIRGYGDRNYSQIESSQSGVIQIPVRSAPFSTFALFRSTAKNQQGDILVFAGGNTSAQAREVFNGPVHINDVFHFYGHPIFNGPISSSEPTSKWEQLTANGYNCCAVFNDSKTGGVPSIEMPTEIYSVIRVAAGDPSHEAAIDNTPVSTAELVNLLRHHVGGSFSGGQTTIPNGIYIPTAGPGNLTPSGGIYVQGDAEIYLNVVKDQSDFHPNYWTNIDLAHRGCRFQKIRIDSLHSGVPTRDIYVGDDPCEVTYVFNASSPSSSPSVLSGRINGNLHVNGKIDKLGGESRTRPAIARDFGFTISAKKDVRIINDIQYEDVAYKEFTPDGEVGGNVVTDPWDSDGSGGFSPTSENIIPTIDPNSKTILGLISTHRNVLLHIDAPPNLNLHAAIFAGNDDAYNSSTGLGCGTNTASQRGCGFGNEGWSTKTGMGTFKFLGSVSEYKSQTMGRLSSPPTGYQRRLAYDTRLRQDLMPPAFPLSSDLQAYPRIQRLKTWKLSSIQ